MEINMTPHNSAAPPDNQQFRAEEPRAARGGRPQEKPAESTILVKHIVFVRALPTRLAHIDPLFAPVSAGHRVYLLIGLSGTSIAQIDDSR